MTETAERRPQGNIAFPPLHAGQAEVAHDPARFKVLTCGRRWGKTRLGSLLCLATALKGGTAWWVAPTYKMAYVGWRTLKRLSQQIPDAEIREGDRTITFPWGGWLQVRSTDDPDSLRGEGLDGLVLDECAFIPERAWVDALRPALSDRKGWALFISTPKGMNWFWRMWVRAGDGEFPEWRAWRFPTSSNPYIAADEIEAARGLMPERSFQQEYEAVFLEEAGGVFRSISACVDTGRSEPEAPRESCVTYYAGVDLARVEDFTVITVVNQQGRQVYFERFNQISWERQIARVVDVCTRYRVASCWLDSTGVGDPIFEALRKSEVRVRPYQFTNASKESLIDSLAMGIEGGRLRLMDLPTQTNELLAYQYELTPSRNIKMGAPEGMHDDCVIALALAWWSVSRPAPAEKRSTFGRVGGWM